MGGITGAEQIGILADKFGYRTVTATIAKDASLSDTIDIADARSVAFYMPATWDAAGLTFQVAITATGSASNLYHFDGTEVVVPTLPATGVVVGCPASSLSLGACRFIKIRSGTAAAPVVQTRAKTITVLCKG